jgi:hypothetical protein
MDLETLFNLLIALASGLGLGKILEKRQNSSDEVMKFLQQEISQTNKEWRTDLKSMIISNHAEMMNELSAIKKAVGRGNRLIETGSHGHDR